MTHPRIIAITGGIGSGKSVVSRILRIWGYDVFDCDSEAKALMDVDMAIKERLRNEIAEEILTDGVIDRRRLAEIVFADSEKLAVLNGIAHRAVRDRLSEWAMTHNDSTIVFVETAILHSSGMINDVDAELRVTAPENIRIDRVMKRNNLSAEQVRNRIASQQTEEFSKPDILIINDGETAVVPQLIKALRQYLKA